MLIGFLMAMAISIFVVSGVVIMSNFSAILHSSITAAAIGGTQIYSTSLISLIISALVLFILLLVLKHKTR